MADVLAALQAGGSAAQPASQRPLQFRTSNDGAGQFGCTVLTYGEAGEAKAAFEALPLAGAKIGADGLHQRQVRLDSLKFPSVHPPLPLPPPHSRSPPPSSFQCC